MKLSKKGADFIASHEGVVLRPYNDPVGYATIGVGHLLHRSKVTSADIAKWKGFTRAKAIALLQKDAGVASHYVNQLVKVKLTQNQFDALVSFVFNVGGVAFMKSTLLDELNKGHFQKAADQLLRWDVAGGKHLPGLAHRRLAERKLFLSKAAHKTLKTVTLPMNWWKRYVYGDTDCDRDLLVRLAKIAKAHKTKVFVRSGKRTYQEQVALYAHYLKFGSPLAARPGTSRHQFGHAADCGIGVLNRNIGDVISRAELRRYGLHLPVGGESWHVERV